MTLMEYTSTGLKPQWKKTWFYERLFFKVVIALAKDKKIQYKRYSGNGN